MKRTGLSSQTPLEIVQGLQTRPAGLEHPSLSRAAKAYGVPLGQLEAARDQLLAAAERDVEAARGSADKGAAGLTAARPGFGGASAASGSVYQLLLNGVLHGQAKATPEQGVRAARAGDLDGLRVWLRAGGDPNRHDAEGWTPLLAAAVRGRGPAVELLLSGDHGLAARPDVAHRESGALPIHFAGQSGSVEATAAILRRDPTQLDRVWSLNGHGVLLQAIFYDHPPLVRYLLENHRPDRAQTTARGLGPVEMARQFNLQQILGLLADGDPPAATKQERLRVYLSSIAPLVPPGEAPAQRISDRLVSTIEQALRDTAARPAEAGDLRATALAALGELLDRPEAEVDRLGGPLAQPPLVVAVTGANGSPEVAALRREIVDLLLARGADPTTREAHPMAVHAIVRALVFGHLELLQQMAGVMDPRALTEALNWQPIANGMTGFHDTVKRAATADPVQLPRYLALMRWCVDHGARTDLEDFGGVTVRELAAAAVPPASPAGRAEVLAQALAGGADAGRGE